MRNSSRYSVSGRFVPKHQRIGGSARRWNGNERERETERMKTQSQSHGDTLQSEVINFAMNTKEERPNDSRRQKMVRSLVIHRMTGDGRTSTIWCCGSANTRVDSDDFSTFNCYTFHVWAIQTGKPPRHTQTHTLVYCTDRQLCLCHADIGRLGALCESGCASRANSTFPIASHVRPADKR